MIKFFETENGVKGVIKINNNKILSIICQGVPGTRVEGRNFLVKASENMIDSDVIRFEPRGMGYSEGEFYNLTHNSWLADIALVLHEGLKANNNYTNVNLILMSDAAKMIVDIIENLLVKLDSSINWQIILINGVLTKENTSGPNKTRIVKTDGDNWGLYTGFGVFFSFDFLDYYPDEDVVKKIIYKNREKIRGIYGTEDDLTINSKSILTNLGVQTYKIQEGDHLFTNKNGIDDVMQSVRGIYNNYAQR